MSVLSYMQLYDAHSTAFTAVNIYTKTGIFNTLHLIEQQLKNRDFLETTVI